MTRWALLFTIGLLGCFTVTAATEPAQDGRTFLAEGDSTAAVKSYAEALRLMPFDPVTLNNMGVAKAAAGDYQAALDFFLQANSRAPHRRDIKENLDHLQAWVKSFFGALPLTRVSADAYTPEPPPLWSPLPNSTASPDSSPPINPICNNDICK